MLLTEQSEDEYLYSNPKDEIHKHTQTVTKWATAPRPPVVSLGAGEYMVHATMQTTGGHVWDAARVLLEYLRSEAGAHHLA